ncbi:MULTISPECIES: acyltransferase domain-containing protein, partial [unclassified Streptomyces]|uniref:acyltransferase domain-containing protein n=1 Tax=unclassified Streptomyces TaxID=2593676 RepID=UPI00055D1908
GEQLAIATHNGPTTTVVSGDTQALDELLAHCEQHALRARRVPVDYASHCAQVEELRDELLVALQGIVPGTADVPFHSTVTATPLDGTRLDPEYWYGNLRHTVRFEETVAALLADGDALFIEVSPHPVMTVGIAQTTEALGTVRSHGLPTLRRSEGGPHRYLASLAAAWIHGAPVSWAALLDGTGARRTTLPTYPFQRQRYWLEAETGAADAAGLGLSETGHPLLAAAVGLAERDEYVFTGRLSRQTHPWLADHAVAGTVLVPGTGLLELALHAAGQVGSSGVAELALAAPLVLPEHGGAQLQLTVGAADESGQRSIDVHARIDHADEDGPWTLHARGVLAGEISDSAPSALTSWPPAGAAEVDLTGAYERLADQGYEYGPAFQGLRRVWRSTTDGAVFAEVALADELHADAARFDVHPALLDAALHTLLPGVVEDDAPAVLPFSWSGVRVHAVGASMLRVRLIRTGPESVALDVADATGAPVAAVESLATRPLALDALEAAATAAVDGLFHVQWQAVPVPAKTPSPTDDWAVLAPHTDLGIGHHYPDLHT